MLEALSMRRLVALFVILSVLAVGGLAAPAAADSGETASADDGVTIEEGELVCIPGSPVSCYFVGTETSVNTDNLQVNTGTGAVAFRRGQAYVGVDVDATADVDDIFVDAQVCYLSPEEDQRQCFG